MEELQQRFKDCDPRFWPYLEKVFNRLPPDLKADIFETPGFQILADEALHEKCVMHHGFAHPVETLVLVNTKLLGEADHRILLALASEIAYYAAARAKVGADPKEAEVLLRQWGFGAEIEAVRYDEALAKSSGYQTGYRWARNQNKQYLLQHFGLYYDAWKTQGWSKMSRELRAMLERQTESASFLEDIARLRESTTAASGVAARDEGFHSQETIIAGIVRAMHETDLREGSRAQTCEIGLA
ncbi:MAG: hypothetical protein JSW39_07010 [Desulfobacterales bacterium]|nr:MAG: hypothetical protein JSW39_07010 [Desulfobacterales bacterium]